jgi:hypothetical protein
MGRLKSKKETITCSGGLLTDRGDAEVLDVSPDPARTFWSILLIWSCNKLSAAAGEPPAQIESRRIKTCKDR